MKLDKELAQYKSELVKKYGRCQLLNVAKNTTLKNCNNTAERVAYRGWPWIEYWQAMTGNTDTQLTCSSCGKIIFVGDVPKVMQELYAITGNEPDDHKALGGHLWVRKPTSGNYPSGYYIAPICPKCNNKRGKEITILRGTTLCKELGAETNEGE